MQKNLEKIVESFVNDAKTAGAKDSLFLITRKSDENIYVASTCSTPNEFAMNYFNLLCQLQFVDREANVEDLDLDEGILDPEFRHMDRSFKNIQERLDVFKEVGQLDYPAKEFDPSNINLMPQPITHAGDLTTASKVRDVVNKYSKSLRENNFIKDFLIFTNVDDTVFEVDCSEFTEKHTLTEDAINNDKIGYLVARLLSVLCYQFKIDPYVLLQYMYENKDIQTHNALVARTTSNSNYGDVILHENASEGRVDFPRSVQDFLDGRKIRKDIISAIKIQPKFVVACVITDDVEYHLHTVCSKEKMLDKLTNFYASAHEPISRDSFDYWYYTKEYMQEIYFKHGWIKDDNSNIEKFTFSDDEESTDYFDTGKLTFDPNVELYFFWVETPENTNTYIANFDAPDELQEITQSLFGGISLCYKDNNDETFYDKNVLNSLVMKAKENISDEDNETYGFDGDEEFWNSFFGDDDDDDE